MAAQWLYTHGIGQHRIGPVTREKLKQLADEGQLTRQSLVWTVGMSQWSAAPSVPGLFDNAAAAIPDALPMTDAALMSPATAAPSTAPAPAPEISYESSHPGLPARAAAALAGHAHPRGDTYHWPLDDRNVMHWDETLKIRKKISAAAQLYRALLLILVIAGVIFCVAVLTAMGGSASARRDVAPMLVFLALVVAFCVLYQIMARATMRSKAWAPLTMFILFLLGLLANAVSMTMVGMSGRPGDVFPAVAGGLFAVILPAVFAIISWRAYTAIPRYLAQPAWCQELIVKANL